MRHTALFLALLNIFLLISCTTETNLTGCPAEPIPISSYSEGFESAFINTSKTPPTLESPRAPFVVNTNADFGNNPDPIQIDNTTTARAGSNSIRLTVFPDDFISGGNRSEISYRFQVDPICSEAYYAWSFKLDANYDETGNFNTVGQWHTQPSQSGIPATVAGPIFQEYLSGNLYVVTRPGPDFKAERQVSSSFSITPGVWVDVIYHIKWSPFNDGFVEAWIRSVPDINNPPPYVRFLERSSLQTVFNDSGNFFKLGLYRSVSDDPVDIAGRTNGVVYYDEIRIGNNLEEVSIGMPPMP